MSEKTEKPTPKKLEDARKKGQVPKSKEIVSSASIIGMTLYFWLFFKYYVEHAKLLVELPAEFFDVPFQNSLDKFLDVAIYEFLLLSMPVVLFAALITIIAYLAQVGGLFALEPVMPDLKKINPLDGVKRIFAINNLIELIKSIVKIGLLGIIVFYLIKNNIDSLLKLPAQDIDTPFPVLVYIMKRMVLYVAAVFIVIAALDHFFQKYEHTKKLRMSKDDIKQEHKNSEGDPHVKGQRRQLQREMSQDNMVEKIKLATVVVIDPNRFAAVLYYKMGETPLPILSVKGRQLLAKKIQKLAEEKDIPIVQNNSLAWDLFKTGKENNYIPTDLIGPVAEVIRQVST